MKLGKSRIHLLILLFAVSSLLVHSPPEAFAAEEGDITAVRAKILGNHLEHHGHGAWTSLVHLDSDTYVLAFQSGINKSGISTFTISPDGNTITELDFLLHDTSNSGYNSLVKVDSDTVALAYRSSSSGIIKTFDIDSGGDITLADSLTHTTGSGGVYNSLVHVASDTFALAYQDSSLWMATFTINSDGDITAVRTETNSDPTARAFSFTYGSDGSYPSMVQVDSDTYAVAHTGPNSDGFITTFNISSDGTTITEEDVLEHDEINGKSNSLVQVDSDTFALAYKSSYGGYISTFDIDNDGDITAVKTQSEGNNLNYDAPPQPTESWGKSFVKMDSDTFALAHDEAGWGGRITTFNISSDGQTITKLSALQHDTDYAARGTMLKVDSDTVAIAYYGGSSGGSGGIISTFTISIEPTTSSVEEKKSSSDCYDCEAPKLTKVEVHVSSSPFDYVWNFDQKSPYPMFDDDITPIVADPGDEVEIILELTDNRTLERVYDSGTYTNFLTKPNDMNTFYANNFDEYGKVSTTYYEWHQTGEDLVYDYDNTVEWSEADVTIEESGELDNRVCCNLDGLAGTFTISFKMKFLQPMQTSDVWVQATDRSGNFFKVALPLTLKISGNEPLLFESKVNQKVLSFFDESMLSEVVSDWTGTSQDVSELAKILGIPDEQLPPWVTNLAVWVSEDRITLADMIVSIEHLINN